MNGFKMNMKICLIIVGILGIGLFGITSNMTMATSIQEESIPLWIKNNAGWWADGSITTSEYINSLQFLIDENIIRTASAGSIVTNATGQQYGENLQEVLVQLQRNTDAISNLEEKFELDSGNGISSVSSTELKTYVNTEQIQVDENFKSVTIISCDSGDLALSVGWSPLKGDRIVSILPENSQNPESWKVEMAGHSISTEIVLHVLCADITD